MYTVKTIPANTVLETIPVNGRTIKNLITTNGGTVSYIVLDENGNYNKSPNIQGKMIFDNFTRKSAAQRQADYMNKAS